MQDKTMVITRLYEDDTNVDPALYREACDLAYDVFEDPHHDYVAAVYERLVWNQRHGLGTQGAVTIH